MNTNDLTSKVYQDDWYYKDGMPKPLDKVGGSNMRTKITKEVVEELLEVVTGQNNGDVVPLMWVEYWLLNNYGHLVPDFYQDKDELLNWIADIMGDSSIATKSNKEKKKIPRYELKEYGSSFEAIPSDK